MPFPARPLTAGILLVLLVFETTGCYSWRTEPAPVPQALAANATSEFRLHLRDGRRLTLALARIVGDSVVGMLNAVPVRYVPNTAARDAGKSSILGERVAVPLADVIEIEHHQFDAGDTILLMLGLALVVPLVALIKFSSSSCANIVFCRLSFVK